jgi:hypothetical protein
MTNGTPWQRRPSPFNDRNMDIFDRFQAGESPHDIGSGYGIGATRVRQIVARIGRSKFKDDLDKGEARWHQLHDLRRKIELLEVGMERLGAENKLLAERLRQIHNLTDACPT